MVWVASKQSTEGSLLSVQNEPFFNAFEEDEESRFLRFFEKEGGGGGGRILVVVEQDVLGTWMQASPLLYLGITRLFFGI